MRIIMVAGDFGKGINGNLHPGHRDHIQKAAKLGDFLIIVTHRDSEILERKGYQPDALPVRLERLTRELVTTGKPGAVVLAKDTDGTVAMALSDFRPDVFAKGGDRTPDNMPQSELAMCRKLGIEIVYGVGDRLGQSREIAKGVKVSR